MDAQERNVLAGLNGLLKSAQMENPKLIGQLVGSDAMHGAETLVQRLEFDAGRAHEREIRYRDDGRWVADLQEVVASQEHKPWQRGGTYLITGGAGGLGLLFAREIAADVGQVTLLLAGRSALDEAQQGQLQVLRGYGAQVEYLRVDVSDRQAVQRTVQEIRQRHGNLTGVIHSAGVLRDSFLLKKSEEDLRSVFAGKVAGAVNLDEATAQMPLEFFVVFSSGAGVFGNIGQGDYAAANAFLDEYARVRAQRVHTGRRSGRSLSIDWPLWAEGGMGIDTATREVQGLPTLSNSEGMQAFYRLFGTGESQVVVIPGAACAPGAAVAAVERAAVEPEPAPAYGLGGASEEEFKRRTIQYLKRLLAGSLKLEVQRIEADVPLERYGIDSIKALQMTRELEKQFGSLPKTLFFEYQDIEELSHYFIGSYRQALMRSLGLDAQPDPSAESVVAKVQVPSRSRPLQVTAPARGTSAADRAGEQIAIVGLSGRYPQARDLSEFWENLRNGKDCIEEIPAHRWDWSRHFDERKGAIGKSYSKWGGFIPGVDEFDPLFFSVSPLEARFMDPQERLFLQCAYQTLEDAGYTRDRVHGKGERNRVGVFVGVMYEEYQLYGAQAQETVVSLGANPASIANRVSYFCNFQGPSLAVDTMCSSSLTAIHLACESLKRGECAAALAGGVNVTIHPNKYLGLSQGQFASSKGRCESFGEGGDGYVPGEGVGAVLLKPLQDAVEAGDHIYGVIRGTALNHGGKTNGYTVPNPAAQAQVIEQALKGAGVSAREISYIEAHGTGTSLGDPIEIAGLSKAFAQWTQEERFCRIGSAKSNIGHCESAAGIAGVTKVLLQMKHRTLVPSLHSQVLNPHIDFERSPFVVQRELSEWLRPTITIDGKTSERSRIAGISSFGAGGANAHVVIEEYVAPAEQARPEITPAHPAIIVLSAKDEERLKERVRQLLRELDSGTLEDAQLESIAYTLQVGREAMEQRLALIVSSTQALREKLHAYLDDAAAIDELYRGEVRRNKEALVPFAADEDLQGAIEAWIEKGKHGQLLDLWVKGLVFDWNRLYRQLTPRRISLPSYPFAKERYWISAIEDGGHRQAGSVLHPLLHENASYLGEQRYRSVFTGEEFFLRDHQVQGSPVLPGVAYLEMARAALAQGMDVQPTVITSLRLNNVVWSQPLVTGAEPAQVYTALYEQESGRGSNEVCYEIYTETPQRERVIHSQGIAATLTDADRPRLDVESLARRTNEEFSPETCYRAFDASGLQYGPGHRGLQSLRVGTDEHGQTFVLARVAVPAMLDASAEQFVLHPSVLDAALQAAIGLALAESASGEQSKPMLPYALDELQVWDASAPTSWVVLRESRATSERVKKLDLQLCDEHGQVWMHVQGLSLRPLEERRAVQPAALLAPHWQARSAPAAPEPPEGVGQRWVVFAAGDPAGDSTHIYRGWAAQIEQDLPGTRCRVLESAAEGPDQRFTDYALQLLGWIQDVMSSRPKQPVLVQLVIGGARDENPGHEHGLLRGLGGLLKSARLENPKLIGQLIELEGSPQPEALIALLTADAARPDEIHVRYQGAERQVAGLREVIVSPGGAPWRSGGTYLITGGAGGLGMVFAQEIAGRVERARLLLAGRGALSENQAHQLQQLRDQGAQVEYLHMDVSDRESVRSTMEEIRQRHGELTGVIHSAGVLRDSFLLKKSEEELRSVFAAKVAGIVNLDMATAQMPLDLFVAFSSAAGVFGNIGQADYAMANAFMDAYLHSRALEVQAGRRQGRTLSINWPLWAQGGMRIDAATQTAHNLQTLSNEQGLQAFYGAFASVESQIVVLAREHSEHAVRPTRAQAEQAPTEVERPPLHRSSELSEEEFTRRTLQHLKKLLAGSLRMDVRRIETDVAFEQYGIDSVIALQMTRELEKQFGSLSKTLLFEYRSIEELGDYFIRSHREQVTLCLGLGTPAQETARETTAAMHGANVQSRRTRALRAGANSGADRRSETARDVIAIVGLSGRYPQARDIGEYWENLKAGRDCIEEIPVQRWDQRRYFDERKGAAGKSYSKWGGFIPGMDEFDPLFFSISPLEAQFMDPQERLFLQCAYQTLEDAGYTRESAQRSGECSNVGVFVGVMYEEYQLYGAQAQMVGTPMALAGHPSSIANRVSYFCNFHGPSLAVDTMCSSSLTAIHLACESLKRGECAAALAGGVNVSIHPNKYLALSQGHFASSKGRCESFGEGGDGYVPGEGVGAVLLKPLQDAVEAGDHIYGVIRGTALNHGGKTNGYTVPNPQAQAEVVEQALKSAGVSAREISYIEAHGTGTSLGDPIEIAGLSKAFAQWTQEEQFCGIGSAKSNIGHCESAAGIAALTKVLLQMKHQLLVPTLHSQVLNPHIDFERSPFIVQRELSEWVRPVIAIEGRSQERPRIAGISAFGAGGANAHVVVEEYVPGTEAARIEFTPANPALIVLSAKDEQRLHERVQQLLGALERGVFQEADLASIAYTLQVGREAMEQRLALLVSSMQELCGKLKGFLAGEPAIEHLFADDVRNYKETLAIFNTDTALRLAVLSWLENGQHTKLLELWVKGLAFDWTELYGSARPARVALPTYPFAREHYWLPGAESLIRQASAFVAPDRNVVPQPTEGQTVLLRPQWQVEQPPKASVVDATIADERRWIIVCEEAGQQHRYEEYAHAVEAGMPQATYVRLCCEGTEPAQRYEQYALKLLAYVQTILSSKPRDTALIQLVIDGLDRPERSVLAGLNGLLKTAQIENPTLSGQLIGVEGAPSAEEWTRMLQANALRAREQQIRCKEGSSWTMGLEAVPLPARVAPPPWRRGDVYLITGGVGGLGLLFAHEIAAQRSDVSLILAGRSTLGDAQREQLQALAERGAQVQYVQLDVSDRGSVERALADIRSRYGRLNGVIHSAGVIRDGFLSRKSATDLQAVFAAKVAGVVNLDEASREDALEFFVAFSSIAGALGNVGQGDYAMANAFMDEYIRCRARSVEEGRRAGRSVSINWPLWADGGMQLDPASEASMHAQGLRTLTNAQGIAAFYQAFSTGEPQVIVLSTVADQAPAAACEPMAPLLEDVDVDVDERQIEERTSQQLIQLFSHASGVPTSRLDVREPLESYGIDSVMVVRLNELLQANFSNLPKTLFFECPSLAALSGYLVRERRNECVRWSGLEATEKPRAHTPAQRDDSGVALSAAVTVGGTVSKSSNEPIAIIGLSGRYPRARDVNEYWENLRAGRDCIGEIPAERWRLDGFYCADVEQALARGESYCKWGGFIEGFSEFDPLFFNISPREAESIDPQERLFMQSCWEVLEDAGYTREALADSHQGRVGVFAGITKTGFELHGPELRRRGQSGLPRTSFSSLANRVSYFLNLNGPSMPIDTMCSASLTAIHEACEHLLRDECELAIAGGVNLYLHQSNYVAMCGVQMLSATGRCRSFGAGADGMVPGEGVGSVLLKRLSLAIEQGDFIYAVIRGTSINHGGKTNGYTVPNPRAQRELVRTALRKANIDARTVSYIEAHGTGTELGDPIEIAGLTQAFEQDSSDKQYCAIGSAKSNLGHLEAAAGIAGLTKVLLQMKHRMLVPSLHADELNPHIDLECSPFVVQRALTEWKRPIVTLAGQTREYPRIAGISSFGAGGSNAHIVLEEYEPPAAQALPEITPARPAFIVLSAKDTERLKERARQLLGALEREGFDDASLARIAYTLQVGREAMERRLAFTAASIQALKDKLSCYLREEQIQECWEGDVKSNRELIAAFAADEELATAVRTWIERRKHHKLLDMWSKGLTINWLLLYGATRPRRVPLPCYPFARNEYWLPATATAHVEPVSTQGSATDGEFEDECLRTLLDAFTDDELSIDNAVRAAKEIMSV
jgi:acyl transferase domain-containing protein/acyl carrier protein